MSNNDKKITNPYTKRKITINGKKFNDIIKHGEYIYDDISETFVLKDVPHQNQTLNQKQIIHNTDEPTFNKIDSIEPIILNINKDFAPRYIIHLADIHIPLNLHSRRNSEFRQVFDNLYGELKKFPPNETLIIIVGDILDTKLKLEAETVQLTRDFLCNLNKIAPTIVTIGNHDFAENNPERMDNVTAMCDRTNVISLKKTGLYKAGKINLVFNSLYDQKFIHYDDLPIEIQKEKVCCLYHGTVIGSFNFNGTENKKSRNKPYPNNSDFKDFDYVLLGHIHKRQFLDKRMAYCGSLLQKNFGESIDKHGFILWDIENNTVKDFDIYNHYVHLNITANGEQISDDSKILLDKYADRNLYLKINCLNSDTEQRASLSRYFMKHYNTISIQFPRSNSQINNEIKLGSDDNCRKLYNSLQEEEFLINKFSNHNLTDKILDYHRKLHQTQNIKDSTWFPIKLKWSNLFGYGGDVINEVDFSQGVINICAPNTAGKTSIVNIHNLALFDKVENNKSGKSHLINSKSDNGFVEITFVHNGQEYIINKCIQRSNKNTICDSVKTHFYHICPYEGKKLLNHANNTKTSEIIQQYVGKLDDFTKTNMITNGIAGLSVKDFASTSDITKFFEKLFNIDRFAINYAEKSKKERKELDKIYKNINARIVYLEEELQDFDSLITEKQIAEYDGTLNNICSSLNDKYTVLKNIQEKKSDISNKLDTQKNRTCELENSISISISSSTSDISEVLNQKKNLIENTDAKLIEQAKQYNLYSLKNMINIEKEHLKPEIGDLEKDKNDLKELKEKLKGSDSETREQSTITSELAICEHRIKQLSNDINLKIQIANDLESDSEIDVEIEIDDNIDKLKQNQINIEKELHICRHNLNNSNSNDLNDLNLINNRINELQDYSFDIGEKHAELEISQLKTDIKCLEKEINTLETDGFDTNTNTDKTVEQLELERKNMIIINDKFDLPNNWKTILDKLQEKLSANNIPDYKNFIVEDNKEWFVKMPLDIFQRYYESENYQQYKKNREELCNLQEKIEHNQKIELNIELNIEYQKFNKNLDRVIRGIKFMDLKKNIELKQKRVCSLENYLTLCNLNYIKNIIEKIDILEKSLLCINSKKSKLLYLESMDNINKQKIELQNLQNERNKLEKEKEISEIIELITNKQKEIVIKENLIAENKRVNQRITHYNSILEVLILLLEEEYYQLIIDNKKLHKDLDDYQELLNKYNKDIYELETDKQNLNQSIFQLKDKLERLKQKENEYTNSKSEVENIREQISVHEEYERLMDKNGLITNFVLDSFINQVIKEADNIASKYLKYNINYDFRGKNLRIFLNNKNTGEETSLHRLSGYECAIFMIAMCRAMGKVSFNKADIFIIDERLDCFDRDKFDEYLPSIFDMLRENFRSILFISHRDVPSDVIDDKINIVQTNQYSYID